MRFLFAVALALILFPAASQASSIKSPIVTKGEAEIELQGNLSNDDRASQDGEYGFKTGMGLGVTDHWFVELDSAWEREPQDKVRHKAVAIENRFQILPQGEYMLDLGLYAEYEFTTQAGAADELTFGPIVRSDVGHWRFTANPFAVIEVGAHSAAAPAFKYGLQGLYLFHPLVALGVESYGQLADAPQNEQTHQIGAILTGKVSAKNFGLSGKFGYEAGVLFGLTSAATDQTYRLKLEYEWAW